MKNKIPLSTYCLFSFIYFNQGIWGLTSLPIYNLQRYAWGWSVSKISMIASIIMIPWVIKPAWGIIVDSFPLFKKKSKYWLVLNYFLIMALSLWVVFFNFTPISFIIIGILLAYCFSFNDVSGDGLVCVLEKKHNLQGKLQSLSWFSLSFAGLATSIGGAWIAKNHHFTLSYLICIIFPLLMIYFILRGHDEPDVEPKKFNKKQLKEFVKVFFQKKLLMPMGFLFLYFLSPSFGTPLRHRMLEVLHMDMMMVGLLGGVGTVFGLFGYMFYFFKAHKFDLKKLLYFSVGFGCFSTLWYLWIPNQWWLFAYSIILGTVGAVSHLVILAYVAKITPKGYEALVFAGLCSVLNLGSMGSACIGGLLYDAIGFQLLVIISVLFTFGCLFIIPHLKLDKLENDVV